MSRSRMQLKDGTCYICARLYNRFWSRTVEEHHVFGGADRKKSEHDGLKVYLCPEHHRTGPDAAHVSPITAAYLHTQGQAAFEAQGHTRKEFMERYGRSYL